MAWWPGRPRRRDKVKEEKAEGYLEWRQGDTLIVDGQKVSDLGRHQVQGQGRRPRASPRSRWATRSRPRASARPTARCWRASWRPSRTARPCSRRTSSSMTDQAESEYRKAGRFFNTLEGGKTETVGWMFDSGPKVERARRIVDNLLPPYVDPSQVRVYVIENKEWNAFAMGNYSIYLFSGIMDDLDDDELAIVLGHEIAHATHEHTRRQFKKAMWIQLAAIGVSGRGRGDRRQEQARRRPAAGGLRRPGLEERLRPRHGGPGGPRGAALRVRGRLRHHQGPAPVAALRQEVRRVGQGGELLLQRPLAVLGARRQPRAAAGPQLRRRTEVERAAHGRVASTRPSSGHPGPAPLPPLGSSRPQGTAALTASSSAGSLRRRRRRSSRA